VVARRSEMSFLEHLEELRGTLFRVIILLLVGMIACFAFADRIQSLLTLPFDRAAARAGEGAGQLVLLAPTEGFIVHVKIALFAGLMVVSPLVFWQIWRFVSPGLHKKERRAAFPVILSASVCFLGGAAFGFNMLSFATEFFLTFATTDVANQWSLSSYIGFVTQLVLAFGLVFELPLVIFILSRMGIVSPATLSKFRRHAIVGILLTSAILTPPDPISQVMLAGPVYLLFELSILISRMVYRRRQIEEEAGDNPPDDDPSGDGPSGNDTGPAPDSAPEPEAKRQAPESSPVAEKPEADKAGTDSVSAEPQGPAADAAADGPAAEPQNRRRRPRRDLDLFDDQDEWGYD
jgi:sec-independent protein translocase protein TatC